MLFSCLLYSRKPCNKEMRKTSRLSRASALVKSRARLRQQRPLLSFICLPNPSSAPTVEPEHFVNYCLRCEDVGGDASYLARRTWPPASIIIQGSRHRLNQAAVLLLPPPPLQFDGPGAYFVRPANFPSPATCTSFVKLALARSLAS